jgi:hypothetical protein
MEHSALFSYTTAQYNFITKLEQLTPKQSQSYSHHITLKMLVLS